MNAIDLAVRYKHVATVKEIEEDGNQLIVCAMHGTQIMRLEHINKHSII